MLTQTTLTGHAVQKGDMLEAVYARPIVYDKLGQTWVDTVPKWIVREVYLQRIAQSMHGESGLATDAEVVAHIYTACMTRPISHEMTRVYLDLACKLMEKRGMKTEMRAQLGADRPLTDYEQYELKDLKQKLWNASVRHMRRKR